MVLQADGTFRSNHREARLFGGDLTRVLPGIYRTVLGPIEGGEEGE